MDDTTATDLQLSMLQGAQTTTTPHIPYLPNGVMYMIGENVDDEDLKNLRLSAKVFHDGTATRFATTFFEERAYELSPKGFKALVDITEHATFARHIKTVIICHGGGKHSATKYHSLIQLAFRNLAVLGNTISIGLRRVKTSHNYQSSLHAGSWPMMRFLEEKMLPAARRVKLALGCVVTDMQNSPDRLLPSISSRWARQLAIAVLNGGSCYRDISGLQISLETSWGDRKRPRRLSLDLNTMIVRAYQVRCEEWEYYLPNCLIRDLRELHLEGCRVPGHYLALLFERSGDRLECISLRDVRIETRDLRRVMLNRLASQMTSMASHEVLKSCRFNAVDFVDDEFGDEFEVSPAIEANTPAEAAIALSNLV
ncbi:hypothetical protein E4T39_01842 [Aureobasidium subglaciale]|nr:hypothetical protein E4T39_01842 [Aureobasidium subglaciale]